MLIDDISKEEIKKARELLGMTHEQFGSLLGVNHQKVMMWERGYRFPDKLACAVMRAFLIALKDEHITESSTNYIMLCLSEYGRGAAIRKTFSIAKDKD